MLTEDKVVKALDDVLLVFRVMLVQRLDQFGLDETLLVETLLVFEDLQRDELFLFMVENAKHNSERSLPEFLNHFVAIAQMLIVTDDVLLLV